MQQHIVIQYRQSLSATAMASMDYQLETTHACKNCGMKFYNAQELVNHIKRFCVSAGLDSLEGLAQYNNQSHKRSQYKHEGMHTTLKNDSELYSSTPFTQNAKDSYLNKAPVTINRPCSNRLSYLGNQKIYEPELRSNTNLNQVKNRKEEPSMISKNGSRVLGGSDISIKPLDNFGHSDNNYYSPPSQMPHVKPHNNLSMLNKSNTSIAQMTRTQKQNYATDKLLELDNIAEMYDTSGGNNVEFRNNVNKMRKFYKKMLNEEGLADVFPAGFAESRVQTPINKLRNIHTVQSARNATDPNSFSKQRQMKKSQRVPKFIQISQPQKKLRKNQSTNQIIGHHPPAGYPYQPYPYPPYPQQPQIIMIPQYQNPNQQQPSNAFPEQLRYLQQMITMKNTENQKLMQMLIDSKNNKDTQQFKQNIRQSQLSTNSHKEQQKYYFQNAMSSDITPQQKILTAMQREQLDQLRLLSSLPEHLQQVKMQSVIKLIQARTQLQKQILEQKMKRLEQKQRMQHLKNERQVHNNQWVTKQKRSMIQQQMQGFLKQYQQKLEGEERSESQQQQGEAKQAQLA